MLSQFFHVSLYGRRKRPGAARHETARGMLNEAARVSSATGHLPRPTLPRLLYGRAPSAIAKDIDALAKASRDCRGRKLRSDAGLLMCVVASYPVHLSEGVGGEYEEWLRLTLEWLKAQFCQHLAGVVEHTDEAFRHVHAFALPPLAQDGQLRWEVIHPGRRAKREAAASGAAGRDQDAAYVAAMKAWQDSFHGAVSSHFGHARLSVGRERRSRGEHLLITSLEAENARLAAAVKILEQRVAARSSPARVSQYTQEWPDRSKSDDYLYHEQQHESSDLRDFEDDPEYDDNEMAMDESSDAEWEDGAGNDFEADPEQEIDKTEG